MRRRDCKRERRSSSLLYSGGNASGTMRLDMPFDGSNDMGRYLVGYQTTGDFGVCLPGDHCLVPFPLEASPDPIDIESWTRPVRSNGPYPGSPTGAAMPMDLA